VLCFGQTFKSTVLSPCHTNALHISSPKPRRTTTTATMQIVTYNVLTPSYCNKKTYPFADDAVLDDRRRLELLKSRIEEMISSQNGLQTTIVCLQEVCESWANDFSAFFGTLGYAMQSTHYGSSNNGYMGVAIAYPLKSCRVVECNRVRVSDYIPESPFPSWFGKVLSALGKTTNTDMAKSRNNRALVLNMEICSNGIDFDRNKGNRIVIATYHMPCMFKIPAVMEMHLVALRAAVADFSVWDECPTIIAGDFNVKATDTALYNAMIGAVDDEDDEQGNGERDDMSPGFADELSSDPETEPEPEPDEDAAEDLCAQSEYQSAGAVMDGYMEEPAFTTYTQSVFSNIPFKETLDYILYKGHNLRPTAFRVFGSDDDNDQLAQIAPNALEPSDHLPITATFEF
jgi:mRNA deadenylase 3'-5' endonuclease subunit Ccr4